MNSSSSTNLPATVHTEHRITANPPPVYHTEETAPPTEKPSSSRRRSNLRVGVVCLIMTVGLGAVLIPALRVAHEVTGGTIWGDGKGNALVQGLLQGGLPPANSPLGNGESQEEESSPADTPGTGDVTGTPIEPDTEESPSEAVSDESCEPATEPETHEISTAPPAQPPAETLPEPETDCGTESETVASVPDGCYPIVSVDMSYAEHGIGYILSDGVTLPQQLPEGRWWSTDDAPAVLIINTHPYEGYSDGEAWYDPTRGSLAVTATPHAIDGTVALSAALTRALREAGVTVIHLRIAVSASDTAADIYSRTETMVRYYCRLYPDIGLVVNLRRSAELTEEGAILRTAGSLDGESCAQVRISVSGGRDASALGRDLAVALALRAGLWDRESTVSRPVWVKPGEGPVSDLTDVCVLTLEVGSAGNTYAEAGRLVPVLARILGGLVLNDG